MSKFQIAKWFLLIDLFTYGAPSAAMNFSNYQKVSVTQLLLEMSSDQDDGAFGPDDLSTIESTDFRAGESAKLQGIAYCEAPTDCEASGECCEAVVE